MPRAKNFNLHGMVPENCPCALLVIDMFNSFCFPGGGALARASRRLAPRILALKRRLKAQGVPAIYVNDNFGRWRSNFSAIFAHCLAQPGPCGEIAALLAPEPDDYIILKPKASAFYGTPLDVLLDYLNAHRVILTGITSDNCIFFTAADVFLRDMELYVPSDCVTALHASEHRRALAKMRHQLKADTRDSARLRYSRRRGI
jgi:nicotinamidase-related amidase